MVKKTKLATYLFKNGMTIAQLSRLAKCSHSYISAISTGRKRAPLRFALDISFILNEPLYNMFAPEEVSDYDLIDKIARHQKQFSGR